MPCRIQPARVVVDNRRHGDGSGIGGSATPPPTRLSSRTRSVPCQLATVAGSGSARRVRVSHWSRRRGRGPWDDVVGQDAGRLVEVAPGLHHIGDQERDRADAGWTLVSERELAVRIRPAADGCGPASSRRGNDQSRDLAEPLPGLVLHGQFGLARVRPWSQYSGPLADVWASMTRTQSAVQASAGTRRTSRLLRPIMSSAGAPRTRCIGPARVHVAALVRGDTSGATG